MTSHILFTAWVLLPLIGWALWKYVPSFRVRFRWLFLTTLLVGYCLLVGSSRLSSKALKHRMDQFDLDGNGRLSVFEMTPEAKQAMANYASDTGRTFAPFTAGPMTAIYSGLWYAILGTISWGWRKLSTPKGAQKAPNA